VLSIFSLPKFTFEKIIFVSNFLSSNNYKNTSIFSLPKQSILNCSSSTIIITEEERD